MGVRDRPRPGPVALVPAEYVCARADRELPAALRELTESGKVTTVIDRTHTLREVPAAIRYVETEHTRAKIVITMANHYDGKYLALDATYMLRDACLPVTVWDVERESWFSDVR